MITDEYVVVLTTKTAPQRTASQPETRDAALTQFAEAVQRDVYGPDSGRRIAVMSAREWAKHAGGGS